MGEQLRKCTAVIMHFYIMDWWPKFTGEVMSCKRPKSRAYCQTAMQTAMGEQLRKCIGGNAFLHYWTCGLNSQVKFCLVKGRNPELVKLESHGRAIKKMYCSNAFLHYGLVANSQEKSVLLKAEIQS
jgi:hypothetical protein